MASMDAVAPDPLVLQVLGCGADVVCDGVGSVYEDGGVSNGYESEEYRLMQVSHNSSAVATAVTIHVSPHACGGQRLQW